MDALPLVINLEGALLATDLSTETLFSFLRNCPGRMFDVLKWSLSGKAYLKEKIAGGVAVDPAALLYHQDTLDMIHAARARGTPVVLVSSAHKIYAEQVAAHLGLFDRVLATEGRVDLSGDTLSDLLIAEYGIRGFDYVGACAKNTGSMQTSIKEWARALRCYQWVKNILIFAPLFAGHYFSNLDMFVKACLAFILFSFCASSVYLFNDLFDLNADRQHAVKKHRPFAAGRLSARKGLTVAFMLMVVALSLALLCLPWPFAAVLGVYFLLNFAYSSVLKQLIIVDVLALAVFYTLRIIAGGFAIEVAFTFWMIVFSIFLFLSLALVKRYAELAGAREFGQQEKLGGRAYRHDDKAMVASMGVVSGYLSVLVLAFYIQDPATAVLYAYPQRIWLACLLLLFWVSRVWLLTSRGQMHTDPIIFAMQDKVSLAVGVLFVSVFWLAL